MWFHSGSIYEFLNSFLFAYDCPCPWINTLDWLGKGFSYTLFAGRKLTAQEKYSWVMRASQYPMRLPGCRSCSFVQFINTQQVHLRDSFLTGGNQYTFLLKKTTTLNTLSQNYQSDQPLYLCVCYCQKAAAVLANKPVDYSNRWSNLAPCPQRYSLFIKPCTSQWLRGLHQGGKCFFKERPFKLCVTHAAFLLLCRHFLGFTVFASVDDRISLHAD